MRGVLPTWQVMRTASMWRECGGQPFEIPPFTTSGPDMVNTLQLHPRPCQAGARRGRGGVGLSQPGAQRLRARLRAAAPISIISRSTWSRPARSTGASCSAASAPTHARYGAAVRRRASASTPSSASTSTRAASAAGARPARRPTNPPARCIERGGDPLAPPIGQPVTTTSLPIRTPPSRPLPSPYRPVPTTQPAPGRRRLRLTGPVPTTQPAPRPPAPSSPPPPQPAPPPQPSPATPQR